MITFLKSILFFLNDGGGIITLFVGLFVFILYRMQQIEHKRNAAKLILQEIRYAEQQLKIAKDHDYEYHLFYQLLPTSSWNQNINFFIKDLEESELDLISKFYSQTSYIDRVIGEISNDKFGQKVPLGAPMPISKDVPLSKPQIIPGLNVPEDKQMFIQEFESLAEVILKSVSRKTEFVYNTPAVDKLRNIANRKWYEFFRKI